MEQEGRAHLRIRNPIRLHATDPLCSLLNATSTGRVCRCEMSTTSHVLLLALATSSKCDTTTWPLSVCENLNRCVSFAYRSLRSMHADTNQVRCLVKPRTCLLDIPGRGSSGSSWYCLAWKTLTRMHKRMLTSRRTITQLLRLRPRAWGAALVTDTRPSDLAAYGAKTRPHVS